MNKKQLQADLDKVNDLITDLAEADYKGNAPRAFLYWSAESYLGSVGLSDFDITDSITEGKDDQEADLVHIDDGEQTVYILGSRYHDKLKAVTRRELQPFMKVLSNLTNPALLKNCHNSRIIDKLPEIRRCIRDGYGFELVWATNAYRTDESLCEGINSEDVVVQVDGKKVTVDFKFTLFDLQRINEYRIAPEGYKATTINIEYESAAESNANQIHSCLLIFPVKELVRVFRDPKNDLFKFNPRYFLGPKSTKDVNSAITKTLENHESRKYFHIYNNGLSGVCEWFKVHKDSQKVEIFDLQIVNGCQTTILIDRAFKKSDPPDDILVGMKLIGGEHVATMRAEISRATNTQNAMKDWDFLYYNKIHSGLANQFPELKPRLKEKYYYERRRGEFTYIAKESPRNTYKITIMSAAQVIWAFEGHPGDAKDTPRDVANDDKKHREVFFDGITAAHIRLPWEILKEIEKNKDVDDESIKYAKFHILWLIGELLKRINHIDTYKQLKKDKINKIFNDWDTWFSGFYATAVRVVRKVVEDEVRDKKELFDPKQFFRVQDNIGKFTTELTNDLKRIKDYERNRDLFGALIK